MSAPSSPEAIERWARLSVIVEDLERIERRVSLDALSDPTLKELQCKLLRVVSEGRRLVLLARAAAPEVEA